MKLRMLREKHNLTQEELAKEINICLGSIGLWETGKAIPRQSSIRKLHEIFGEDSLTRLDFMS